MIRENFEKVLERIERAAQFCGRNKQDIRLLAVSKTVPVEAMREAAACGIQDFGESRIQEALPKQQALTAFPVRWHMIGQLQSNKTNRAVQIFDVIQSVDSLALAQRINRQAEQIGKIQDCYVELKVSEEPTKTGLHPSELKSFLDQAHTLQHLQIKGLMCIAPYFEQASLAKPFFARARALFETHFLNTDRRHLNPQLSMGMSHDLEAAIEEGSTLVRVGTALFGPRVYS